MIPSIGYARLDKWRASRVSIYTNDFGELAHYRNDNERIKKSAAKIEVVFFGDSIIGYWNLLTHFSQKPYINRGINGHTTSQMLVRFWQDVVELKPQAVVMLASNNDLAGLTGPMQTEDILFNYAALTAIAHANNIKVIFLSMLPVHNYTLESQDYLAQRPLEKIKEINSRLKKYALSNGHIFLDIYSPLLDDSGLLRKEFTSDGLHPNDDAYAIISPLVQNAIDNALTATESNATETRQSVAD